MLVHQLLFKIDLHLHLFRHIIITRNFLVLFKRTPLVYLVHFATFANFY